MGFILGQGFVTIVVSLSMEIFSGFLVSQNGVVLFLSSATSFSSFEGILRRSLIFVLIEALLLSGQYSLF